MMMSLTNSNLKCAQVDAIYFDWSKAFDRMNHTLLLQKLSLNGFSLKILKCLDSYLTDRQYNMSCVF